MFGKT